ncbi:uncharacterized protein LOC122261480 [Penaeus japonicus]|uniref:uncharacterized protein LOC122261480 n=1 Tax=Penaeus japonicus TaxID=27405 RepID=UPI001C70D66B|nr:uncharacterized protein LOC122261480 [Penaeus japonicus]
MMLVIVFIALLLAKTSHGFNESDLVALETSCHPLDPCRRDALPPPSWRGRNCFCDERCLQYADCCIDADAYDTETYRANAGRFTCIGLKQYGDVYMKGTCSEGWEDAEVADLCLRGSPTAHLGHEDLVANLPATSTASSVTYTNYYCAICNDDSHSLTLWQSRWECEGLDGFRSNVSQDAAASSIVFKNGNWGVDLEVKGTKEYHVCAMYPSLPTSLANVTRPCQAAISTCAGNWTDENVATLCQSYTAIVYNNTVAYRNPHCATCNYLEEEKSSCLSRDLQRNQKDLFFNPEAFALLFDFTDVSGSNIVGSTSPCSQFEIWDPFFRKCRSVVCGKESQTFRRGKCVDVKDFNATTSSEASTTASTTPGTISTPGANRNIPIIFPDDPVHSTAPSTTPPAVTTMVTPTNTTVLSNTPASSSNSSDATPVCNKVFLTEDEFTIDEAGTIYVANYGLNYTFNEYVVQEGGVLLCAPTYESSKFSVAMGWVTVVGLGVSCACLLIHLVAFAMVPDLRFLSGKNLASLSVTLILAYSVFIANVFSKLEGPGCVAIAAVLYYLFLSSICWMNAVAFDIWVTFRRGKTELRVTAGKQWRKFVAYCIYSWGIPALATTLLVVLDLQRPEVIAEEILPYLGQGEGLCWFGQRRALFVFFAIPIAFMIVANVVFFICTARIIAETTLSTSSMTSSSHHKSHYKMYLRLAVLTGFTWLSGIVAGYLQVEALWYVFVVLNSLQGVFIFLAFTCRRKVWRMMGLRSRRLYQRGASWVARRVGPRSQGVELKDTTDGQSSATPATSLDDS